MPQEHCDPEGAAWSGRPYQRLHRLVFPGYASVVGWRDRSRGASTGPTPGPRACAARGWRAPGVARASLRYAFRSPVFRVASASIRPGNARVIAFLAS